MNRDEMAIRAVEASYDVAWNSGDIDALVSLFAPEAVVVNPLGKTARGCDEIREVLGEFLRGQARDSRHTSRIFSMVFVTDDVAVVDGEATLDLLRSPSAPASQFIHRFTDVLIKRNGNWTISQVRACMFATDIPR